ncbi:MAG TPA: TetR/AcrR family transcriptional regulator [Nocardioidaceae bacterium]|nr:TetR/AcrR family transcriptional regulator [Nocardioidaceae bacterium]
MDTTSGRTAVPGAEHAHKRRGRPRDPSTDEHIVAAAAELMLSRGFDKMTVDDVATRAGVGKATVYRRWPSKDDLAVAAMEQVYGAEVPEPDTGSVEGDLRRSYQDVLASASSPAGHDLLRASITESLRDERIAGLYREASQRREARTRRALERAISRGEVRQDADLDVLAQWLDGLLAFRMVTQRPLPTVEDVDRLVELALRGART